MNVALLGPSLQALAQRSGAALADMGVLYSALSIGYLVSTPLVVLVSRRFGLRPLLAAAAVIAASLGLFAVAPSLSAMLFAAVLLGFGQSCTQIGYVTWIGLQLRDGNESATVLNRVLAFYGVGALFGPLVVSACFQLFGDALPAFGFVIVPNVAVTLLGLLLPQAQAQVSDERGGAARGASALLRVPAVLWMASLLAVYVGAEVAFSSWVTEVVIRTMGVDAAQAALSASAFFGAFAGGRFFAGALLARTGVMRGLFLLLAAAGCGIVVMLLPGVPLPLTVAAAALVGAGYGPIFPTVTSIVIQRFPGDAAAVSSVIGGIASFGMFLAPPITGWVLAGAGGPIAAWGVQLLLIAAMAAILARLRPL